ncbi:MAG TPA: ATP-binding protein [Polyangiaceae bacterium]
MRHRRPSRRPGLGRPLLALSRSIGRNWSASIARIVQFDAQTLRVERVSFWALSHATASIHCEEGYVASLSSHEHGATLFAADIPEYFAALRAATVLSITDVQADPRSLGLREYCASRGIASMLDVPVWVEGSLRGVLCHEHVGGVRHWTQREEELAIVMGQTVATALAARAHTSAEAAAHRIALLDALGRGLASLDAREIATRAVSMVVPQFATLAVVWMLDRDGALEPRASRHRDPEKNALLEAYLGGIALRAPSFAARVVRQGQSLFIPELDDATLDRYEVRSPARESLRQFEVRSAIAVPLKVGRKTFGAVVFAASDRTFATADLAFAEDIADHMASAMENARLYEVVREAVNARDELLAVTAHELRTPLTALVLRTEHQLRAARRRGDVEEIARGEAVSGDVRRFKALVEHMIDALTIRAQGLTVSRAPCDLAKLVGARVEHFRPRARTAGSAIALELPDQATGSWDERCIEKAVDVLLDNAVKFGNGAPIEVTMRDEGDAAHLVVRDHGIGIPADRLCAIFQPFERAVPREHFGGLGLGLYIARAIVESHGGTIHVTSQPGEGSTFVMHLPCSDGSL